MTTEEFEQWLSSLVRGGRLEPGEYDELVLQRRLFDQNRARIEAEFPGRVVGYIAGNEVIGDSVPELLAAAQRFSGQVYFEPTPNPPQVGLTPEAVGG